MVAWRVIIASGREVDQKARPNRELPAPEILDATQMATSFTIRCKSGALALLLTLAGQPSHFSNASEVPNEKSVSYEREIRPLLLAKCYRCHGPRKQESDLRLDVRSEEPTIVRGKSGESELIHRVASTEEEERMPPEGAALSKAEISLLRRWIDQGAEGQPEVPAGAAEHWAFRSVVRPDIPAVENKEWPCNSIDYFVLAKLERDDIEPSPVASRETIIRRLSLDLLGLPPAWNDVVEFVEDRRPDAYERLVDRLLASAHYGERWARHWLDVARYADSTGYESDQPREIWRYRDWVIDAFNADKPFDDFVIEQIAGDLLPEATVEQRIATGFHCNAMHDPGVRWESVLDRVNTTGSVFLGLTLGCGQCHDHKTDPLTQKEYYQFYAFFNEAVIHPLDLSSPEQTAERTLVQAEISKLEKQQQLLAESQSSDGQQNQELAKSIADLTEKLPKMPTSLVMKLAPQPTHLFVRGDHTQPGDLVKPGVPAFLPALREVETPSRLDLAHWLVDAKNPLTARVTVNRFWQRFFGRGLVKTETDFGLQTPSPTHLDLLDWLASEFVEHKWSIKELHRQIVTSATYRQSSDNRDDLVSVDPENRLLARQRRMRLEAEIIRDVSLSISGLLSPRMGGPSVFPYQVEGILDNRATPATWTISEGEDRYRRGLYTWVWRLTPHPMLPLFDSPDLVTACTRRDRSNVPIQALTLLNDPTFLECARSLAKRILDENLSSDEDRIRLLFRLSLSRNPHAEESRIVGNLLVDQIAGFEKQMEAAKQLVGTEESSKHGEPQLASWIVVCRVILNLDETITRE